MDPGKWEGGTAFKESIGLLKKICGLCVVSFKLEASKGYFAEKSRPASSFAISIAF